MNLTHITFTVPQKQVQDIDLINLLCASPVSELAVHAYPRVMSNGTARYEWFNKFLSFVRCLDYRFNIALHIDYQWCDMMCNNNVPPEIASLLKIRRNNDGALVISRVMLNIGGACGVFNANAISSLISTYPEVEFIFPYNRATCDKISSLRQMWVPHTLMYNVSNIKNLKYLHTGRSVGYTGDNISDKISDIANHSPSFGAVWIDAGVIDSVSDMRQTICKISNQFSR